MRRRRSPAAEVFEFIEREVRKGLPRRAKKKKKGRRARPRRSGTAKDTPAKKARKSS